MSFMSSRQVKICLFIAFIGFCASGYYYYVKTQIEQTLLTRLKSESEEQLRLKLRDHQRYDHQIRSTINFISNDKVMQRYLRLQNKQAIDNANSVLQSVTQSVPWYTKISYVNDQGYELFYATEDKKVNEENRLIDSKIMNYARSLDIVQVGEQGAFLEQIGDNEYDAAVIRITPVENEITKKRSGYIFAYINLDSVTDHLSENMLGYLPIEMINAYGGYLSSIDKYKLYGTHLPHRQPFNFSALYPHVWKKMQSKEEGSCFEYNTLVTFLKVYDTNNVPFYFVITVPKQELNLLLDDALDDLSNQILAMLAILCAIAFPILVHTYNKRKNRLRSQLADVAFESMAAIVLTDEKNRIIFVNREFEDLSGLQSSNLLSKRPEHVLSHMSDFAFCYRQIKNAADNKRAEDEIELTLGDGDTRYLFVRTVIALNKKGQCDHFINFIFDITERKMMELKLKTLSEKDAMTGLWNRHSFDQELELQTSLEKSFENDCILAIVDIDFFKSINDRLGHDGGDAVLKKTAELMTSCLRKRDFIARIGGEEFAVIMTNTSIQGARTSLERLRQKIEENTTIPTTISIGATTVIQQKPERIYKEADLALYSAKSSGRNQVRCFHDIQTGHLPMSGPQMSVNKVIHKELEYSI